jgi:hypothetical protein
MGQKGLSERKNLLSRSDFFKEPPDPDLYHLTANLDTFPEKRELKGASRRGIWEETVGEGQVRN